MDQKVDLYGPSIFVTTTGTWISLGENYSYLTVADVALPWSGRVHPGRRQA